MVLGAVRGGKALIGFLAMVATGCFLWSFSPYHVTVLLVTVATGVVAYLVGAASVYVFTGANGLVNEVVGLYQGAYSLLALYVFFVVGHAVYPSLGVVCAAPFGVFFPAAHARCELRPDGRESLSVATSSFLAVVIVFLALFMLL